MHKYASDRPVSAVGENGERTGRNRRSRAALLLTAAALSGIIGWSDLAGANGPGSNGLSLSVESNASVKGPIRMNVGNDARVITSHITVAPGGHTGWHYHPGPHFVSVISGTAVVYETDCSIRDTFTAGKGFFDAGSTSPSDVQTVRDIHTLRNPSLTETVEVVITDIREPGRPTTIAVQPQPAPCFP